ncbi:MAG: hypothetical protein ABSD57_10065 [Verrucomicrobiota bacterium]
MKIANRGKDFLIDQLKNERNRFFDQLLSAMAAGFRARPVAQFDAALRVRFANRHGLHLAAGAQLVPRRSRQAGKTSFRPWQTPPVEIIRASGHWPGGGCGSQAAAFGGDQFVWRCSSPASFALGDMADFGRFVMTICYDWAFLRA